MNVNLINYFCNILYKLWLGCCACRELSDLLWSIQDIMGLSLSLFSLSACLCASLSCASLLQRDVLCQHRLFCLPCWCGSLKAVIILFPWLQMDAVENFTHSCNQWDKKKQQLNMPVCTVTQCLQCSTWKCIHQYIDSLVFFKQLKMPPAPLHSWFFLSSPFLYPFSFSSFIFRRFLLEIDSLS